MNEWMYGQMDKPAYHCRTDIPRHGGPFPTWLSLRYIIYVKRVKFKQLKGTYTRWALENYIILLFKVVFSFRRAFDVELLYIAQKLKITLAEVAVNWTEIEG